MIQLFEKGILEVGCNYWASHAGTAMWHEWNAESVRNDFAAIASQGITVVRVFPLWPDFQPLRKLVTAGGVFIEMGFGENPLPDTEAGHAGVDPVMMERFRIMANLAAEYNLRLVVGLLTGWMSGRLFVPPAFEGCNVLADAEAIRWEVRFVRYFVRSFCCHSAIGAWDLGNECNCLASKDMNSNKAWQWTNAIASAIRLEDVSRPVVSGMHSVKVDPNEVWNLADQGELTDVLTTHPYPLFTSHCSIAPFNRLPSTLHATAESCLYADVSKRPCFPEEAGSLGPMIASDERAGLNLQTALASAWAHDLGGFLWWCAFDQEHLHHAPYDWVALERELGLFRRDRSPKPTALAMGEFRKQIETLPFEKLPQRRIDGICLLTPEQDQWQAAFGAFLLSKQAGFDLKFAYSEEALPESDFYLMPAVTGTRSISRRRWQALLERIRNGASLFVTEASGMLQPFREVFGCRVDFRFMIPRELEFSFQDSGQKFRCSSPMTQKLLADGCEVLAAEADGSPVLTQTPCGKGQVFFLNCPIEQNCLNCENNYDELYRMVWARINHEPRLIVKKSRNIGVTEHRFANGHTVIVMVNYDETEGRAEIPANARCLLGRCSNGYAALPGNMMAVFEI